MKRVTLIIPDEYDNMLSVVIAGNRKRGGVNAAQYLTVLDAAEITLDLAEEIAEKEQSNEEP